MRVALPKLRLLVIALAAVLTALPSGGFAQTSRASSAADYERQFARYDITEGGWLSGTELDACRCRHYDMNGDGEVTRNEFLAGRIMEEAGVKPTATPVARPAPAPARPQPQARAQPAPVRAPAPARKPAPAPVAAGGLPVGKYNCHYTSMMTVIAAGSVTILPGGRYQYLNGGTGSYAFDRAANSLRWLSGPFAGSGVTGEFTYRDDGRPLIRLRGGNFDSHTNRCVGPAK